MFHLSAAERWVQIHEATQRRIERSELRVLYEETSCFVPTVFTSSTVCLTLRWKLYSRLSFNEINIV